MPIGPFTWRLSVCDNVNFYKPQGKVMFSKTSVTHSVHGRCVVSDGVCVVSGVCRSVCVCSGLQGRCVCRGCAPHGTDAQHWTRGTSSDQRHLVVVNAVNHCYQYASYWNAFLLVTRSLLSSLPQLRLNV